MTGVFAAVLGMSLAASIAAAAVLILRLALRKAPKIYSYVLWAVVFFRLLVPVTLQSPFGLVPSDAGTLPGRILYQEAAPASSGSSVSVVTDPSGAAAQSIPVKELSSHGSVSSVGKGEKDGQVAAQSGITQIVVSAWLTGGLLLLGYSAFHYLRLSRRLKCAVLLMDGVFESDRISTAFVLGLLRPRVYIPAGLPPEQLDFILRHERTHIRRRDHLIKPLAFLALVLHWFNPVVWISYFLMAKDMEMSCDESVLRHSGGDIRGEYSGALLGLSVRRAGLLSPLAFGEDNIRARVKNVLRYRKPAAWSAVLAAVLVIAVIAGCAANRTPASVPEPPSPPDSSSTVPKVEPTDTVSQPDPAPPAEPDPLVLKYYNYFRENHSLTDNTVFTVDENSLQAEVMYFAFMNTEPIDGNADNVRTKKQLEEVLDKYFGIKPKRYNTGSTFVTPDGAVQTNSFTDVVRYNRLLLKKLTDNGDGSYSAVFKLYQIMADSAPADFDARILAGDAEMESCYTMDVDTVFTEIPEGDSWYLRFSKFTLIPREGGFAPPPQETDYGKKVLPEEVVSYHGLSIGMTLEKAKELLRLPESTYVFLEGDYADMVTAAVDGWYYTFSTLAKERTDDRTQYLRTMQVREYQGELIRGIRLGDAYEDVTRKFPKASEEGQTLGTTESYATRDYGFADTLRSVDIFTGDTHFSMTFGIYGTLAWVDINAID